MIQLTKSEARSICIRELEEVFQNINRGHASYYDILSPTEVQAKKYKLLVDTINKKRFYVHRYRRLNSTFIKFRITWFFSDETFKLTDSEFCFFT